MIEGGEVLPMGTKEGSNSYERVGQDLQESCDPSTVTVTAKPPSELRSVVDRW